MFDNDESASGLNVAKALVVLAIVTCSFAYGGYSACHYMLRRAHSTDTPQDLPLSELRNPPPSYYVNLTGVGLSETFVYEYVGHKRKHWTNVIIAAGPIPSDPDSPVAGPDVNVVIISRHIHNMEELEREFEDGQISGFLDPDGYRDDMLERENPGIRVEKCFCLVHGHGAPSGAPVLECLTLGFCLFAVGACAYVWLKAGIYFLLGSEFANCRLPLDVICGLIAAGFIGLGSGVAVMVMGIMAETGGQNSLGPTALLELGAVLLGMGVGSCVESFVRPLFKKLATPQDEQAVIDAYVGGPGHAPLPPGGDMPPRW